MIEELFNFDNIHSLNFVDKQVLVLVLHLAPAGTLSLGLGLGTWGLGIVLVLRKGLVYISEN